MSQAIYRANFIPKEANLPSLPGTPTLYIVLFFR